jgi:6-phosphogluconate dehydrogenase
VKANNAPLWEIKQIVSDLKASEQSLRTIITLGSQSRTPLFCLGAALASLEGMTQARTSANFIQALRDSFGAHTYQRIDKEGTFHTEWGD